MLLKRFNLKKRSIVSFASIINAIFTKENALLIKKYNIATNKGINKNSTFRFLFRVWEASNCEINICEAHAKIELIENILVKVSIFWLNTK